MPRLRLKLRTGWASLGRQVRCNFIEDHPNRGNADYVEAIRECNFQQVEGSKKSLAQNVEESCDDPTENPCDAQQRIARVFAPLESARRGRVVSGLIDRKTDTEHDAPNEGVNDYAFEDCECCFLEVKVHWDYNELGYLRRQVVSRATMRSFIVIIPRTRRERY
jgi:hypothetical protein